MNIMPSMRSNLRLPKVKITIHISTAARIAMQ